MGRGPRQQNNTVGGVDGPTISGQKVGRFWVALPKFGRSESGRVAKQPWAWAADFRWLRCAGWSLLAWGWRDLDGGGAGGPRQTKAGRDAVATTRGRDRPVCSGRTERLGAWRATFLKEANFFRDFFWAGVRGHEISASHRRSRDGTYSR